MTIMLCGGKGACTRIEFVGDGVEISDTDNQVKLSSEEWNLLVEKVKSGELKKVE